MASLRKAAACVGLSGPFSVYGDFFGYWSRIPDTTLSVLKQIRLLQGKHIHLNLIRTARFDSTHIAQVDAAVNFTRNLYATVGIGIGRLSRFSIKGGFEIIMSWDVAPELFDSWSAPNDGIDAFLCYYLNGPESGRSPTPGSCDKSGKDSGLVVGVLDNQGTLGVALAHELGHFLGLDHESSQSNLMYKSTDNSHQLTGGQAGAMKLHCSMKGGCPT